MVGALNPKTLAAILMIAGIIVGIGIGYAIYHGGGQPAAQIQTRIVEENYTIQLRYSPQVGIYLTDSKGRTLYFFAKDVNGSSACYGGCAEHWPPFYVEKIKPSPGLNPGDFSVITRKDGTKQLTYKGWPLYYFYKDEKPGDVKGDGVKKVWYVAKPDYTVLVGYKEGLGLYLVDAYGKTLYFFAKDANGVSACYGACAEKWPVFSPKPATELIIPSVLNLTDFSFLLRNDGKVQVVYKGHPLYYWYKDQARGQASGHGVKGVWFVADIGGGLPQKGYSPQGGYKG